MLDNDIDVFDLLKIYPVQVQLIIITRY